MQNSSLSCLIFTSLDRRLPPPSTQPWAGLFSLLCFFFLKIGIGAEMEKQIGNLTVSTPFAGIHTEQNVRRHFSKGGIILLSLRRLALVPHPRSVGAVG